MTQAQIDQIKAEAVATALASMKAGVKKNAVLTEKVSLAAIYGTHKGNGVMAKFEGFNPVFVKTKNTAALRIGKQYSAKLDYIGKGTGKTMGMVRVGTSLVFPQYPKSKQ